MQISLLSYSICEIARLGTEGQSDRGTGNFDGVQKERDGEGKSVRGGGKARRREVRNKK